ncbi:MAG: sulfite exporter TauE/SafE family protein [Saprospiraceae bacterium]
MVGLWAAFTVGLFGSLHCVGMCGPIAAALPYPSEQKTQLLVSILLYNSGRILTYGFLGLIFGLLGATFSMAGFQQVVSISLGVFFLLAGIFSFNLEKILLKWNWTSRIFFFVKSQLSIFLQKKSLRSLFFIGVMNGFLPCGLVYVALAGAIASGSILEGMMWMILFGLGTIPLMAVAGISGKWVSISLRNFFKKTYPFVLIIFALLLIVRGLNIEIPENWYYLNKIGEKIMCH